MGIRVAKFGGTSLADAGQFGRALEIVKSDERRCYVVPSAPGKRYKDDIKVTDMLLTCHKLASQGENIDELYLQIEDRYNDIITGLGLEYSLEVEFEKIRYRIKHGASVDYIASRGEYLSGKIMAAALGWDFIDAADAIFFNDQGRFDPEATNDMLGNMLRRISRAVIPGFYGSLPDGRVKTFSRGGSDVTGAIVARAANAEEYENWTDVSGFKMADPRIVPDAKTIDFITYKELRELSYMGASVLHEESVFPVRQAGIPVRIKNTNHPEDPGTVILDHVPDADARVVTGVAGRKGYSVLTVDKGMMNEELGFGRRILAVLEERGMSFEHLPTGIDTLSVVLEEQEMAGRKEEVLLAVQDAVMPDRIEYTTNMALIATVGQGMVKRSGVAARLFTALAEAGVNIKMIDQGSSELNIIIGVEEHDFETALRAIYYAFESFV